MLWPNFLALIGIGSVFFIITLTIFRKSLAAAQ